MVRFIEKGSKHLAHAVEPEIRAEVQAEFAEELGRAAFWRRPFVQHRMEREISRRIRELVRPDSLY